MEKKILGVLLIAVICVTSGAYALLSDNSDISDSTPVKLDTIKDIDLNFDESDNVDLTPTDSSDSNNIIIQNEIGVSEDVLDEVGHSLNDQFNINYVNDSIEEIDLTDRYIQCVICGGFIPLGSVENPLPDNVRLCSHPSGSLDLYDIEKETYSRDEVCELAIGLVPPRIHDVQPTVLHRMGDNPGTLEDLKVIIDNAEEGSNILLDNDYIANSTATSIVINKNLTIDGGNHILCGEKIASINADWKKVSFVNTGFYDINLEDSFNSPDVDVNASDNVSFIPEDFVA